MKPETVTALCEPFPAEMVGKLPRITCGACSDTKGRVCGEHKKSRCNVCGNWITEKHIHLDYVGHADVTNRLIAVDPDWTWEPMAVDDHGLPIYDADDRGHPVGMWIKLTVDSVTRLGYGSCPSGQSDAVKVLIGDALRNAAMRFGVATDLWAKGDRAAPDAENATSAPSTAKGRQSKADPLKAIKVEVAKAHAAKGYGSQPEQIHETFVRLTGMDVDAIQTVDGCKVFLEALQKDAGATPESVAS